MRNKQSTFVLLCFKCCETVIRAVLHLVSLQSALFVSWKKTEFIVFSSGKPGNKFRHVCGNPELKCIFMTTLASYGHVKKSINFPLLKITNCSENSKYFQRILFLRNLT